ncbi:MAG: hypothetical protein ACK4VN_07915 [Bacteroidales bacterium]
MKYEEISAYKYNCSTCPTRCDGKTVPQFDFEKDLKFSEAIEDFAASYYNQSFPWLRVQKTTREGYPDLEIRSAENNSLLCFIEIKGQARTFMKIERVLPHSGLIPSETLALNLSDLERYFTIHKQENRSIFIVWCLMHRPCITGTDPQTRKFWHQHISILEQIRLADPKNHRRFRRASGMGDVVQGQHKGVVVNYHFSITELKKGLPQPDSFSQGPDPSTPKTF